MIAVSKKIQTIGVLTSGGDAPGMNAAVRAVTRSAIQQGIRVLGIRRGYMGLMTGDLFEMNLRSVSDIIGRGGTVLFSARCPEFQQPEGQRKALEICRSAGIDGLVTIGGDGTFRGASALSALGLPCIGIPGTIDNDIAASDYTIGFDTAVNTAVEMIDRIRDTSASHDRCTVVEVMGRHAGHLALHAGLAAGAISILVPEIPFDVDRDVVARMLDSLKKGKQHFIVLVAEGVGHAPDLARYIGEKTGIVTRATVLGHVQRGGAPSARDRIVASQMGSHAVKLLCQGIGDRVVVYKKDQIMDYSIEEALAMHKSIDLELYALAQEISV